MSKKRRTSEVVPTSVTIFASKETPSVEFTIRIKHDSVSEALHTKKHLRSALALQNPAPFDSVHSNKAFESHPRSGLVLCLERAYQSRPDVTTSRIAETSAATIGICIAIASSIANGSPSQREVRTTVAARRIFSSASFTSQGPVLRFIVDCRP